MPENSSLVKNDFKISRSLFSARSLWIFVHHSNFRMPKVKRTMSSVSSFDNIIFSVERKKRSIILLKRHTKQKCHFITLSMIMVVVVWYFHRNFQWKLIVSLSRHIMEFTVYCVLCFVCSLFLQFISYDRQEVNCWQNSATKKNQAKKFHEEKYINGRYKIWFSCTRSQDILQLEKKI